MILYDKRLKDNRNSCMIKFNKSIINYVNETKYLGVLIDDHLTFDSNSVFVTNKIAKKLNLINRMNNSVSSYVKSSMYKSVIFPHLKYCGTIMLNYSEERLNV